MYDFLIALFVFTIEIDVLWHNMHNAIVQYVLADLLILMLYC